MGLLDLFNAKRIEEEKRKAAEEAREEVVRNNMTNLSNLSKGSQVNFAIPFFDVFDPRFMDQGVPVAVHGNIVYAIEDMDLFHQVNKNEAYSDETFKNKLKGQVTKFVKGVVSNAPADAQIPVVQLERKIMEISELVQKYVTPKVEQLFGIKVRSLDITSIMIDKESRGYRELKALTADLERERTMAQHNISMEMNQMQTVEQMRMQMEDQRERMRIQREGVEMGQTKMIEDGRYGRLMAGAQSMGGGMFGQQPAMGGMFGQKPMNSAPPAMGGITPPPPSIPATLYHVYLNNQQMGPFDLNVLRQYAQQGQMNAQTQVWTQGMPTWAPAGTIPELASLFAAPSMGGGTPPPAPGTPPPTMGSGGITL